MKTKTLQRPLVALLSISLAWGLVPAHAMAENPEPEQAQVATIESDFELSAQADPTWKDAEAGVEYAYRVIVESAGTQTVAITRINVTEDKQAAADGSIDLVIPNTIAGGKVVGQLGAGTVGISLLGSSAYNTKLGSITIPSSVSNVDNAIFAVSSTETGRNGNVRKVAFAEGSPVTSIPSQFFFSMPSLEEVVLPQNLRTLGDRAFNGCASLKNVSLPSTLETIGAAAFAGCTSLPSIEVAGNLQTIEAEAFKGDTTLATATLPNSLVTIGDRAFEGCSSLASVSIGSSMKTSRLTSIGISAFVGTALARADIPDSVTSIGEGAFDGVTTLATVNLGSSQEASQLETIGTNAFRATSITSIALPNQLSSYGYVPPAKGNRAQSAFSECYSLETIAWPTDYVAGKSFTTVGGFQDFVRLEDEVVSSLPWWIATIDAYAFQSCGFEDLVIPSTVTRIGECAFYEQWDADKNPTLKSLAFAEGGDAALRIEDSAFSYNSIPNGSKLKNTTIKLPRRVAYLGEGVFDGGDANNIYYLYNKDIEFGRDEDGWVLDPWNGANSGVCYYPQDAAEGSDILALKAQYEELEVQYPDDTYMRFRPIDAGSDELGHTIRVTIPTGAKALLEADYQAQEFDGSFTTVIEDGKKVLIHVFLDNYAEYLVSPAGTRSPAPLTTDWACAVTTAVMTPLANTGTLSVTVTGDHADECNVAIIDWADGTVVRQGTAARAKVYLAEELPAGTYSAIAYEKNDYFSSIASMADFELMGLASSDYAQCSASLAAQGLTEVELAVPQLDTSRFASYISSGEVVVPLSTTVPDRVFYARVRYAMAEGHAAEKLRFCVPVGMEIVSITSGAKNYGTGTLDTANLAVMVDDLAEADRAAGTITVGLKATRAGSFALSGAIGTEGVMVPVGSAPVEVTELSLDVPQGSLDSQEFDATVYAAPGTEVVFRIGDALAGSCVTNQIGRGQATLRIPDDQASKHILSYIVTASAGDTEVHDTVQYVSSNAPLFPTVHEFSFVHAKETVMLASDGKDVSGGSYTVVQSRHHHDLYSRTWPFTASIDSMYPLEDTMVLSLGMLDESTRFEDMSLVSTEALDNGATRYTYRADVAIGDGNIEHELESKDIPVRFDVVPQVVAMGENTWPALPQSTIDAVKRESLLRREQKMELPEHVKALLEDLQGQDLEALFNSGWRSDTWDRGSKKWQFLSKLSPELQAEFRAIEDHIAALDDTLALMLGNKKPITAYASLDEYLADNYGYRTGQAADIGTLESTGYRIIRDGDPTSVPGAGTLDEFGKIAAPAWIATRVGELSLDAVSSQGMPPVQGELFAQDDPLENALIFQDANGNHQVIDGKTYETVKIYGATAEDIATNGMSAIYDEIQKFDRDLLKDDYVKALGEGAIGAFKAELCNSRNDKVALVATALCHYELITSYTDKSLEDEYHERLGEMQRMNMMDKYYQDHNPDSICHKAIKQEKKLLENYLKDLMWLDVNDKSSKTFNTIATAVGDYATYSKNDRLGKWANHAAAMGSFAFPMHAADYRYKAAFDLMLLKRYRAYREAVCRHDAFGKLHYKKNAKIDPSGFTYAGVESNRVEGATTTIYQLVDGQWKPWDEAAAWDEVNPQTTTAGGLFAWDVPQGTWKVLAQAEGYEDAWSGEMGVPPEWTNVGINLLRADAPVVESHAVPEGYGSVDVVFDQWMKVSVLPRVTMNGVVIEGVTWLDAVMGRDETGAEVLLARTLRVPLTGFAAPGATLEVAVDGAVSYTGKAMAGPHAFAIEIPSDAVITDGTATPDGGTAGGPKGNQAVSPAVSGGKGLPKTGDAAGGGALLAVAVLGGAFVLIGYRRRRVGRGR